MEYYKIGIEILLILLGIYIIFFKSFIQEKGKNLATKEDIGKITEEIEKVKNEFSFQNQKTSDLFFERKNNLIKFYDYYFLWEGTALKISDVILGHHKNPLVLRESLNNIKEGNRNVYKYYTRLLLYVEDQTFLKVITNIYNETIFVHNVAIKFLITLEETSLRLLEMKENISNKISNEFYNKFEKEHKEIREKRDRAFEDYFKENEELKNKLESNKKLLVTTYKKIIINEYNVASKI